MADDKTSGVSRASDVSAPSHNEDKLPEQMSEPTRDRAGDKGEDDAGPEMQVPADMQQFIGRQLRAVYDDVAKQPIPDRFLELMKQLEAK